MIKSWDDDAWDDYLHWQTQDKKTLKRINSLLTDIDRQPFSGIGKPELLTGNLSGYWSRKIDDCNRIVYRIKDNQIEIIQCGTHYRDKQVYQKFAIVESDIELLYILTVYNDGGTLANVASGEIKVADLESCTLSLPFSAGQTAKAFVWYKGSFIPLCDAVVYE